MYKLIIRPILFRFDAERIHEVVFHWLKTFGAISIFRRLLGLLYDFRHPSLERNVLGMRFRNPVGLGAGFDKDARLIDELACLGFGFIEIGTLTPKAQPGNDKPRLFRLPADKGLINRMGFNNGGVANAVQRLKQRRSDVIVGGNIGKNKVTPNEQALDDYLQCVDALHEVVDYFVVNVSSPNTPGLRALQEKEPLTALMRSVRARVDEKPVRRPLLLKIAPDLTNEQLNDIIEIVRETGTDGLIATNTTINRSGLKTPPDALEKIGAGGLSGAPLNDRSLEVLRYLRAALGKDYPIISVGGIMSPDDAVARMRAGATLVQVYTGFIYEGPAFVGAMNRALREAGL